MAECIGLIGIGAMGGPMGQNLLNAGHSLVIYSRTRTRPEVAPTMKRGLRPSYGNLILDSFTSSRPNDAHELFQSMTWCLARHPASITTPACTRSRIRSMG